MDKKFDQNRGNQNLGNTGGNLDKQGVRSNVGKQDDTFRTGIDKDLGNQNIDR